MARRGVKEHRPTGLVERPLPGNRHGGCGGRSGETGWSQGQHRASDRPYRLREEAHAAGEKISDTEVQRRVITLAKLTPERVWLGEVASVALVQACRIGRFEPTSQVCSACGAKDGPKPLQVRAWTCGACGTVHDRDVNAARNILAAGRADNKSACGAGVRPRPVAAGAEAGTHRSAA
jgi:Putative transposase DNA-binding domain